jgi:hypothetical protein
VSPAAPQVGTSALLGKTGNVKSAKKCKKGFVKKRGKCVKKKKKKRKKKRSQKRQRRHSASHGSRGNG